MGIGFGALIAGFFGMNVGALCSFAWWMLIFEPQLMSHMEEHPYAFPVVTGIAAIGAFGTSWLGLRTYVQRNICAPITDPLSFSLRKIRRGGLSSSLTASPVLPSDDRKRIGLQLARMHAIEKSRWRSQ